MGVQLLPTSPRFRGRCAGRKSRAEKQAIHGFAPAYYGWGSTAPEENFGGIQEPQTALSVAKRGDTLEIQIPPSPALGIRLGALEPACSMPVMLADKALNIKLNPNWRDKTTWRCPRSS